MNSAVTMTTNKHSLYCSKVRPQVGCYGYCSAGAGVTYNEPLWRSVCSPSQSQQVTHPLVGPVAEGVEGHLTRHVHDTLNVRVLPAQSGQTDIQTPAHSVATGGRHLSRSGPSKGTPSRAESGAPNGVAMATRKRGVLPWRPVGAQRSALLVEGGWQSLVTPLSAHISGDNTSRSAKV